MIWWSIAFLSCSFASVEDEDEVEIVLPGGSFDSSGDLPNISIYSIGVFL